MIDIEKYNYDLPKELIRKQGVEPRDSARLFVYDTKTDTITHSVFSELPKFLPEKSVMVLNNTKVVPARLFLKKETGGRIEVFVLANELDIRLYGNDIEIPVLVDRKCLVGWKLYFPNGDFFEVIRQEEKRFFVRLKSQKTLEELLQEYGETPIPHYLEESKPKPRTGLAGTLAGNESETHLRQRYQTIFASEGSSVAAPTASLHFTKEVFVNLDTKNIEFAEVTLDVGLGTFAPLKDEHFQSGVLHTERISVPKEAADAVNLAKKEARAVIAVGTTALRVLEAAAIRDDASVSGLVRLWKKKSSNVDTVRPIDGVTDIFIYPPYHFQTADIVLTNFHLPKSSLMLLVDAFLEDKKAKRRILDLYALAIKEGYAFYSFGDSMLIL